ncbi:hypothetical protein Scep_005065 [Stephania cephalantha]|uniref:Uncharacterized protein n=1 Tax=Stephania cephalantha TaxID=152367 RepID=A0AAP0KTT7_9MAGN
MFEDTREKVTTRYQKYAGVVTVEGITDVLEVPASLFVEGIVVVQDSIFI